MISCVRIAAGQRGIGPVVHLRCHSTAQYRVPVIVVEGVDAVRREPAGAGRVAHPIGPAQQSEMPVDTSEGSSFSASLHCQTPLAPPGEDLDHAGNSVGTVDDAPGSAQDL